MAEDELDIHTLAERRQKRCRDTRTLLATQDNGRVIWLTQCLCEKRHCILAGAWDDTDVSTMEGVASVQTQVREMIEARQIDPWCRICGSSKFHYETQRTQYRTMEEAAGPLAAIEAANMAMGDLLASTGAAATKH